MEPTTLETIVTAIGEAITENQTAVMAVAVVAMAAGFAMWGVPVTIGWAKEVYAASRKGKK